MKVYFEHNGIKYYDYELIVVSGQAFDLKEGFVANYEVIELLDEGKIDSLFDDSFIPKLDSEIHVVPGCPYAMDDVRKNYKIKRALDSGCCNVFSPLKTYSCGFEAFAFAISTLDKKLYVISSYNSNHSYYLTRLKDFIATLGISPFDPSIEYVDMAVSGNCYRAKTFYLLKNESYAKLLNGELTKPCISYKKLQFANCNDLTMDQIDLLYKTARMTNYSDVPNFTLQLEALNQCNWREYPRSLTILWGILRKISAPVYWTVNNHISTQKKVVKEILCTPPVDKANSKKDYDFAKSIIDHFLGVENVRFTKANTLLNKLNESGIGLDVFSEFYDNMIRLTPKEYEE